MFDYQDWKKAHWHVLISFVKHLYSNSDRFVLKGGTALLLCYGLKRFSEDIDLDGFGSGLEAVVKSFCSQNNFNYRTAKSTEQVKRYMIHYGGAKPLKVEASFREKIMRDTCVLDGALTYSINTLCVMKLSAYNNRDKIRDLYDVVFIGLTYWDNLNDMVKVMMSQALQYKGLDHFDYIISTQSDELIDNNVLAENILKLMNKLNLI